MTAEFGAETRPLADARGSVASRDREGAVAENRTEPRGQSTRSVTAEFGAEVRPLADARGSQRSRDREGAVARDRTELRGQKTRIAGRLAMRSATALLCSALLAFHPSLHAGQIGLAWNGGTGDWSNAANWNPSQVPQNNATDTFAVSASNLS